MPNFDALGYEIFEGGVMWFLGKSWTDVQAVAGTKKVPGYIKLGRSGVYPRKRPVTIPLISIRLHHNHIFELDEIIRHLIRHDVQTYNKYYLLWKTILNLINDYHF